ncbi:MAG: PAS domain S-box protein, partial [Bacteroidetes bacterium]|nr:PAS domain S-box protein [Bacteroidota bacterium]
MKKIKILHLEDNSFDSELILSEIESKEYEVDYTRVETEKAFIENLEKNTFDIILADNNLPTYDGISALKVCSEKYSDYPFIFVSGTLGEEIAIDMLKRGASDYILKHHLIRLVPAIEHAIEEVELKRQKIISEKKYENLVNTASDVIFTLDVEYGIFTSINPAFEKLTGFKISEFIGKPFINIICEDDLQTTVSAYETVKKEKITKTIIVKLKTEWGDFKFSEITGQPLFEDDKLTGILCIGRDITDAIKTEEKIKVLSTAIEQGPASIVITDFKGNIEYVNPKFAEITEYLPVEILGKNPKLLKSGETSADTYKSLWDTITNGGVWHGELKNKKKNGEFYWESESISPVKNIKGEITHFLAVKEDITDKKMKERELISAKEKAEESNRLKTCFLANMSHELRTPMIAILGFAEILLDLVEDKNSREYINLIYEGGERLMETLNLILNLSLIESEKMTVKLSKLDIVK